MPGLLIGLAIGILAAGPGGYFIHSATAGDDPAKPQKTPPPSAAASRSLSPYQKSRLAVNKAKFEGDLASLAEPWLAQLGGCLRSGEPDGPALKPKEQVHVACVYGGISVHFVAYQAAADRTSARDYHKKLNSEGGSLAPGQEAPAQKVGKATRAPGTYIEYAFRDRANRAVCGLWWDREDNTSGMMLEAICDRELNGSWDPLRDLWQRYG